MSKKFIRVGEIYLTGEKNRFTKQFSGNIKIGIAQEKQTSEDRSKKHQTGNSHEIIILGKIKEVEDALVFEQKLHAYLSMRRLYGEWFVIAEDELPLLEAYGIILKDQVRVSVELLKNSKRLGEIKDNGLTREARDEEINLLKKLTNQKERLIISSNICKLCKAELIKLAGLGSGIEDVLSITTKSGGKSFDKDQFMKDHPELHEECMVVKPEGWESKFTSQTKINLKTLSPAIAELIKEIPADIHADRKKSKKLDRNEITTQLHYQYLKHNREEELAKYAIQELELELKQRTGEYLAIEGVSSWKRGETPAKKEFSSTVLQTKYPDLFAKYQVQKRDVWETEVEKYRPYQFEKEEISFESIYQYSSMEDIINESLTVLKKENVH
jgi:hypothetical protein